jgi:RNA-directed DNA polymerase
VIHGGRFAPTEEGTPQGGVISPCLLNVALHGMEEAAGVRYLAGTHAGHTAPGSPVVVRYADDLVALCHSREQAGQVRARLAAWLAPRGLAFNEDKTKVVHLSEGFSFLGFDIRRYPGGKLITKPGKEAVKRFRRRLRTELRDLRGGNAAMVISRLNPVLRGWAAYYRTVVSKHTFTTIDSYLWWLTFKWAVREHRNKPKKWVTARYYGTFNPARSDRWVFGDRSSGAYLTKLAWTKITRHQMVDGSASPDDPDRSAYWAQRKRRRNPPLDRWGLIQLDRQHGQCPLCGQLLLHADHEPQSPAEWEQWIKVVRSAIRRQAITADQRPAWPGGPAASRLLHTHCARKAARRSERQRASPSARDSPGLA